MSHSLEHCIHLPDKIREDPIRLAHYINTDKGFKMIRYFLIPHNVKEFLLQDKFLGEPMIDKCCGETPMPEWFDEEKAIEVFESFKGDDEGYRLISSVIEGITPKLKQIGETKFGKRDLRHEHYLSFHPWQFYQTVIQVGEASVIAAIGNFDKILSMLDGRGTLMRRDLQTTGAQEYRLALPQSIYPPLST